MHSTAAVSAVCKIKSWLEQWWEFDCILTVSLCHASLHCTVFKIRSEISVSDHFHSFLHLNKSQQTCNGLRMLNAVYDGIKKLYSIGLKMANVTTFAVMWMSSHLATFLSFVQYPI